MITVPQYDGHATIKDGTVFNKIISLVTNGTLPKFSREIPEDSVVLARYTINDYDGKTTGASMSFNIQWVTILALPK